MPTNLPDEEATAAESAHTLVRRSLESVQKPIDPRVNLSDRPVGPALDHHVLPEIDDKVGEDEKQLESREETEGDETIYVSLFHCISLVPVYPHQPGGIRRRRSQKPRQLHICPQMGYNFRSILLFDCYW